MPDGVSANKMADFFGQVLGVVASSFQRLSHEYDFQAGMARDIFGVFDVAKKNQIAQAVDFRVRSRVSCGSRRPPAAWALLAKLSRRSPMRSRLIMNFMQASNSRASDSVTWAIIRVTPASISLSRQSSSLSRSRRVLSSGEEAVAMPSAAVAAAFWATWKASMVRLTR